jgi:uncharacterized protein YwbE
MLEKARTLSGYKLRSLDGDIGKVKEFYFDDHHWTIRYLVVDTGDWLADRLVLVSPHSLGEVNKEQRYIAVDLTKKQIEGSPSWNSDKPVSRQLEEDFYGYYGWPAYWSGAFMWGPYSYIPREREESSKVNSGGRAWDPHLRSSSTVHGYTIQAKDGEIGHIADFVVDDETWSIRYMIVDTQNWWPGKKVLVSPRWIERVSWAESKVFVNLLRETIKQSPEYTEEALITRDYENKLHKHYGRDGYWAVETKTTKRFIVAHR